MKKRIRYIVILVIAHLLPLGGFVAGRFVADRYLSNFKASKVVFVGPRTSMSEVMDSLSVIAKRPGSLTRAAKSEGLETRIKPGRYVIEPDFTAIYVVRMLCNGWQTPGNLVLSGSLRSPGRIAEVISRQMMVDSVVVDSLLRDELFLSQYGVTPQMVYTLILPDTYQMYWTASPKAIFDRFKKEYDRFWTPERDEAARKLGLTREEVSTLASIVNGETRQKAEYPVIAGVYLNRLRKGMKLQADPTIAYCFDYKPNRILKDHLAVDSPYNTYKYAGLPPGPINVPPKACIDAVLHPSEHKYLYFCASADFDGTHNFATSFSEHLRNARAFQRELTRRQREASASSSASVS